MTIISSQMEEPRACWDARSCGQSMSIACSCSPSLSCWQSGLLDKAWNTCIGRRT